MEAVGVTGAIDIAGVIDFVGIISTANTPRRLEKVILLLLERFVIFTLRLLRKY